MNIGTNLSGDRSGYGGGKRHTYDEMQDGWTSAFGTWIPNNYVKPQARPYFAWIVIFAMVIIAVAIAVRTRNVQKQKGMRLFR